MLNYLYSNIHIRVVFLKTCNFENLIVECVGFCMIMRLHSTNSFIFLSSFLIKLNSFFGYKLLHGLDEEQI